MKSVRWTSIWDKIPAEARHRVENELGAIVVDINPSLKDLSVEEYLPAVFAGAKVVG